MSYRGCTNNVRPRLFWMLKVFLSVVSLGATSPCMGKSRSQTERYCRKPSGTATLPAPQGRGLCPHPLKTFLKKGFKNSKNFQRKRINVPPRVYEQRAPSVVLVVESFSPCRFFGCDFTLYGKGQTIDGKVLSQAVRYRHPAGSTRSWALPTPT